MLYRAMRCNLPDLPNDQIILRETLGASMWIGVPSQIHVNDQTYVVENKMTQNQLMTLLLIPSNGNVVQC